jgi:glyoxylase-like metal-dependent hydrolase (beta-lactamase superfamily II)
MNKRAFIALMTLLLFVGVVAAQTRKPAGTNHNGNAFRFNKVTEGVYHALGTGSLAVVGNGAVIVNDNDVMIVDDHVSPAAAWVLLDEVKALTKKPVTTVINTHFHFDHAHGNQIFDPSVQIIGHEFTRQMLLGNPTAMPLYQGYINAMPGQIETLRKRIASEKDPAAKAKLQTQLQVTENNYA